MPYIARPSKAEQKLIDFSRESFGEHLSVLLLSGYGEGHVSSSRDFVIELAGEETETHLQLIFVAEGPSTTESALPCRKEPLVLLALLQKFMRKSGELTGRLSYKRVEVLKLLGWGNTLESQTTFSIAVMKYFHTFYQLSDDGNEQAKKTSPGITHKLRLMSSHSFNDEQGGKAGRSEAYVAFSLDFIESLVKRNLFGIDWKEAKRLTPLPAEFFNL
jgi:hypothetical protein